MKTSLRKSFYRFMIKSLAMLISINKFIRIIIEFILNKLMKLKDYSSNLQK